MATREMKAGQRNLRHDQHGDIKFMAEADGYVMCRRPGCMPFVLSKKSWEALEKVGGSKNGR